MLPGELQARFEDLNAAEPRARNLAGIRVEQEPLEAQLISYFSSILYPLASSHRVAQRRGGVIARTSDIVLILAVITHYHVKHYHLATSPGWG